MDAPYGPGNRLTALFAVVTLPLGILAFMFLGPQAAAAVFVVGWLLLVPASGVLFGPVWGSDPVETMESVREMQEIAGRIDANGGGDDARSDADPIDELRDRYARGEIEEAELERRLDALLETEDLDPSDQESIRRARDTLDANPGNAHGDDRTDDESDVELESE